MNHPEEYLLHYHYAALLHQKKKYSEAAIQFQLLLEKLPCNSFLYLSLGKVLEDMDCMCSAETAYQNALSFDWNPETERAYARILSKMGDCGCAFKLSDEIVVDESSQLTKQLSNAEVSLYCGDYENAACFYRKHNESIIFRVTGSDTDIAQNLRFCRFSSSFEQQGHRFISLSFEFFMPLAIMRGLFHSKSDEPLDFEQVLQPMWLK